MLILRAMRDYVKSEASLQTSLKALGSYFNIKTYIWNIPSKHCNSMFVVIRYFARSTLFSYILIGNFKIIWFIIRQNVWVYFHPYRKSDGMSLKNMKSFHKMKEVFSLLKLPVFVYFDPKHNNCLGKIIDFGM